MAERRIAVVPHTHWDREWYEPFQRFRFALVEMLDELLDLLESDPSFTHFLLDGQVAVIDDYLAIRPENEGRLRALTATDRLSIGPWYVLMDEFLVSAETIVRDLQMGIERGSDFGGIMEVGYLPDMFGHVAQMPQILAQAGFVDAVVWRGVPSTIEHTGFEWVAPDGSSVRAEYLPLGYGNGAVLSEDAKDLLVRVRDQEAELEGFLLGDLLLMNGSDHLRAQRSLGRVLTEVNELQDDLHLEISSLPAYLRTAPRHELARWVGELRSGARANLLMGVASNRVDVKRAVARAERTLERRAEPLAALFLPESSYPERFFNLAWRQMVLNAAHDSVCACSVDEVVDQVLVRAAEARQIGEGIIERSTKSLASSMARAGIYLLNPVARSRSGLFEAVILGDELDERRVQVLSERLGLPGSIVLDSTTVKTVLAMLQSPKIDDDAWVQGAVISDEEDGVHLTVTIGPDENPEVDLVAAKAELSTALNARPEAPVFVQLDQPRTRRILARAQDVPGFGWRAFEPVELVHPAEARDDGSVVLDNGLVRVEVDPANGSFSLDGVAGFGRLVDGGDLGDSYNYSPPANDSVVDQPIAVSVTLLERGPVRASAAITAIYLWPDHVDGGSQRRLGQHEVTVTTTICVLADDALVRVETSFVNPARDHRVRVHHPLGEHAQASRAECAFTIVERGLEAEGRPEELGLPTFPSRRFVQAGRLTVIHEGLHEYELVDLDESGARTLAMTVLRSTGMLSRLGMTSRPMPAGPLTPVPGLQLVGQEITARYALGLGVVDPYAAADDVLVPLEVVVSLGGGSRGTAGSALEVSGAEVSSVTRRNGHLEVRLFNPTDRACSVRLPGRAGWSVDLRGRPLLPFEGELSLRAQQFATLRFSTEP